MLYSFIFCLYGRPGFRNLGLLKDERARNFEGPKCSRWSILDLTMSDSIQSGVGNTRKEYKTKAYKRNLFAQSRKLYFSINQRSDANKKNVIMAGLQKLNYTKKQLLMMVLSGINC